MKSGPSPHHFYGQVLRHVSRGAVLPTRGSLPGAPYQKMRAPMVRRFRAGLGSWGVKSRRGFSITSG